MVTAKMCKRCIRRKRNYENEQIVLR